MFDAEERLAHFNQAYVELWQLGPEWLATLPRDGEILDRLRQARRLPEKADYRAWKKDWLSCYGSDAQSRTYGTCPTPARSMSSPTARAEGGVTYLYENVTERISLESRYNALDRGAARNARHVA